MWTLVEEISGSIDVYFVSILLLAYPQNLQARWIILVTIFLWGFVTHSWSPFFIMGVMLTQLSISGHLEAFKLWNYSFYCNTLLAIATFFTFFELSFTYGQQGGAFLRYFQIGQALDTPLPDYGNGDANHSHLLLIACVIMFVVETTEILQTLFSTAIFQYLGKISFMLYVFHMNWIHITNDYLHAIVDAPGSLNPWTACLYYGSSTLILVMISELLTIWIDSTVTDVIHFCYSAFLETPFSTENFTSVAFYELGKRSLLGIKSRAVQTCASVFFWITCVPYTFISLADHFKSAYVSLKDAYPQGRDQLLKAGGPNQSVYNFIAFVAIFCFASLVVVFAL